MKANLKGLDFKQLAINHGEKAGLAVIVLFSLLAVTGMTRWATYQEKKPEDLINQVAEQKRAFDQSQWSEDERQQYAVLHPVTESAQRMLADVDVKLFTYKPGQRLIHSLYKYQEPIREPEWETVDELIATLVRVPIQVLPTSMTEPDPALQADAAGTAPADETDPRLRRRTRGGAAGGLPGFGGAMPGDYSGIGAAAGHAAGGIPLGGSGRGHGAGGRFGDDDYYDEMPGEYGGMGYGGGSTFEVEGVRFVAVRGVFPYRRQIDKITAALNDPDRVTDPHQLIDIIDFELQRQTAQPGDDPWSGPWETITAEKAKEVLSRATDWDQEIVLPMITDPVITCPLPYRVMGEWDLEATHPKVREFKLTEEGREFQELLQARLLQWQEEQEQLQQQSQHLRKGGFADIARDARRATLQFRSTGGMGAGGMAAGGTGYGQQFTQLFGRQQGGAPVDKDLMEQLKKQLDNAVNVGAASHFLLFRFFDYTVVPGNVYRYRVRLELANPNYGRPPEEAVEPSVVNGQTRRTQWSQPTPPIHVEPDAEYFLARSKSGAAYGSIFGRNEQAAIDIFQWLPTVGTLTKGTLDVNLGQFIGGKRKDTLVVVPEKKVGREEVEFETGDMLVDISDGTRNLDLSEHSALGLRSRQLTLGDQALVVNEAGELVALNLRTNGGKRLQAENWVSSVRELYKDLEKGAAVPGMDMEGMEYGDVYDELMMMGMDYDEDMMMPGGSDRGANRRGRGAGRRNPIRR